jgi:hypothetical protein
MMRPAAFALVLLAAAPVAAQSGFQGTAPGAESPGAALERLGILGRWAHDCAQPVVSGNPHIVNRRNGDAAEYTVYFPNNVTTTRAVERVREISPGRIAMHFVTKAGGEAGTTFDVVMAKEGTRQRVVESVGRDGKTYVRDGIVVAAGTPNPWQTRCGDR